jgi:hypothetical protein
MWLFVRFVAMEIQMECDIDTCVSTAYDEFLYAVLLGGTPTQGDTCGGRKLMLGGGTWMIWICFFLFRI